MIFYIFSDFSDILILLIVIIVKRGENDLSRDEFEAFYNKYKEYVYKLCYTYMKRAADAEDCAEDVFVKVLSNDLKFNGEEHEKRWLAVAAANHCKNKLKKRNRDGAPLSDITDEVQEENKNDEVLQAVLSLPDKYKSVVWLYYYDGYKTAEIAKILKKPASTVRNLLSEARAILKKVLE